MLRKIFIIFLFTACIICFSFFTKKNHTPAQAVKALYLKQAAEFEKEIIQLQQRINNANEKNIQQQFLKTRAAYKQIETIAEYFFNYYAAKLNGPAIPFFEENEPDKGQQIPTGMQVIEGLIFPNYKTASKKELQKLTAQLLSDTKYMQTTNESISFNDDFIFDAITEELFRITALGIAGFDSQAAVNGLPECKAALSGVQSILLFYKEDINLTTSNKYSQLELLMKTAQAYLNKANNFDAFNRMEFITNYLNPITKMIGEHKIIKMFGENKSPMFYSSIKKYNTLFAEGIFNVNKFLDDNTTSLEKIELGRQLFFDTQLSKDNKRSCATCHNPAKAFTDGLVTSIATDGHSSLPRNAPTLWNAALQRNLFLDSRSNSLEDQVMKVLNNANEMYGSVEKVAEKIIAKKEYAAIYAKAYPPKLYETAAQNICNAIACYERTLVALNSKFDKHLRGEPSLNKAEINGFNLFMGKAKCGTCHFMPLFNGAKPPRYYYIESEVIGVPNNDKIINTQLDEDEGRFVITKLPLHKYAFKTTTLRNVALTPPYMHNGVYKTLEDVVTFYNNGGGKGLKIAPVNQTLPFDKLNLTAIEQKNIVTFLKTLTDTAQIKIAPLQK
jgi:cytochrome c peroxidase